MTPGTVRRWIRGYRIAAVALPVIAALTFVALARPRPRWTPPQSKLAPTTQPQHSPRAAPDIDCLAAIWQRELRQPLIDAPPPPPKDAPPEPALAVRLIGTAIEAEAQYGVFQLSNNSIVVRPVGAEVEGFRIVAIERGRSRLQSGTREYQLSVPWYDRIRAAQVSDAP